MANISIQTGDKQVYYRKGYKYQTTRDHKFRVPIYPKNPLDTYWLHLTTDGWLHIKQGYAWDGASGPTFDTEDSMRGSLVHDALYQLIRLHLLDRKYKDIADKVLRDCCIEDGMSPVRADVWYHGVEFFGWNSIDAKSEPKERCAP